MWNAGDDSAKRGPINGIKSELAPIEPLQVVSGQCWEGTVGLESMLKFSCNRDAVEG